MLAVPVSELDMEKLDVRVSVMDADWLPLRDVVCVWLEENVALDVTVKLGVTEREAESVCEGEIDDDDEAL